MGDFDFDESNTTAGESIAPFHDFDKANVFKGIFRGIKMLTVKGKSSYILLFDTPDGKRAVGSYAMLADNFISDNKPINLNKQSLITRKGKAPGKRYFEFDVRFGKVIEPVENPF